MPVHPQDAHRLEPTVSSHGCHSARFGIPVGSDRMEIAADWYIAYEMLLTVSMPDGERGCLGICSCGSPAVTRMDFGAFCSRIRAWQFRIQRRGQDCRERDMPQL
jgi:hypothetical protein